MTTATDLFSQVEDEDLDAMFSITGAADFPLRIVPALAAAGDVAALATRAKHRQLMDADEFRRCAELGVCVDLFANHLWYFGDQHVALTVGQGRAMRMDAVRSALDAGVTTAIHSDAPAAPMAPLFTAWCAVMRETVSGTVLGKAQKITVAEALHAITLGAAQTLKMDAEIGSISIENARSSPCWGRIQPLSRPRP